MKVKIYEINDDRDVSRERFLGMDAKDWLGLPLAVDPAIYDEVFNSEIDESDPEEIYRRFNLFVSDVIVTENGAYFCDSIGFQPIAFDESQTRKPEK